MTLLAAGAPLEPQGGPIGRRSTVLVDAARADRAIAVDCWYPASPREEPASVYDLLPDVGFTASAFAEASPAPGSHPLIVFSHGRTGTRSSYAMLCEGLAARGYVVVAPDHLGDTLADWLLGVAVDDATNEGQRVDDLRFVLDAVLAGDVAIGAGAEIDAARIAVAGHSYGAYGALALAGADPGDARIGAVAGLQSFTRSLPASVLARVTAPSLLIVGTCDTSCPPGTDADPAYDALSHNDVRRVDVEHAGHQACSDVGLYLELAPQVAELPDMVGDFLHSMAADVTGTAGDPWRPTVGLHLSILGDWLDEVFARGATN